MVKMYVRHNVADFSKWKPVYDEHEAARKQFGCKKADVFTNTQNPNEVIAVLEWENKDQALQFGASPSLKEVLQRSGVVSVPEVSFVE
jgi:hypothetical protein